jgi:CheY-like chemotaxis protein
MSQTTVLVADDEESVRRYIRNILAMQGLQVIEAVDGVDAMQKLKCLETPLDLLVTDLRMPRMDGIELARAVTNAQPHTVVLYISGYPFDLEEERCRNPGRICGFLPKPFTPKALSETVKHCLASTPNVSCT